MFFSKIIIISLFTCSAFFLMLGCQHKTESSNSTNISSNLIIHQNPRFHFSVEFPENWTYFIEGTEDFEATPEREALPDAGIRLHVHGKSDEQIYIFGQLGSLEILNQSKTETEKMTTTSGLEGKLYFSEHNENIQIIFLIDTDELLSRNYNGAVLGANVQMSDEFFQLYEDEIRDVLRSIKISK